MADNIPVPTASRTPPSPTFQPPTDLVNAYLARPTGYQIGTQQVGQGINSYLENYYKQQQLKASAFEAGGPYLMNMLYGAGSGGGVAGGQTQQPAVQPSSGGMTNPPSAGTPGGATPGNYGNSPQTSAQTMPGGTPPIQQSGVPQDQNQGQVPETIQASLNMGHPDLTGLYTQAQQYAPMGKFGREMTQNLATQAQLASAPQAAAQKDLEMKKTAGELAMQPTEAATKEQQLANARLENKLMLTKPVAEEVSKQTESNQRIGQLKQMYNNLQTALSQNKPSILGNVSADVFQATGGRRGSSGAANVMNAANPLATALNTELSRRFNSGEVQLLSQALIPQAKDTPQYAQQKMGNLRQIINAMQSGNEQSVQNVANALIGGAGAVTGGRQLVQPPQNSPAINNQADYDALPNGASYTWNGKPHVKGKS